MPGFKFVASISTVLALMNGMIDTDTILSFLVSEKSKDQLYVVGNTVLDNLVDISPIDTPTVLITMHRRENHSLMEEYFKMIEVVQYL